MGPKKVLAYFRLERNYFRLEIAVDDLLIIEQRF